MQGAGASAGTAGSVPGGSGNNNVPGNGSSGAGSNTTDGSNNGVNPGLNTGAGGAGSSPVAGTGGSAMGAAGGSMMASGGSGSGMGGSSSTPPVDIPPGDGSCGAGALFCEDFERLAAGPLPTNAGWAIDNGGATLDIDGTTARGARALHIRASGNSSGFIRVNGFSPPGNSFFGRVQLRVDAFPVRPDYAHFVLVETTGGGGGLVRPVGGQYIPGQGSAALWGVGNDRGGSGDWTSWQPSVPTVSGAWICYEWQMRAAGATIDVWLNGVAQPALSVSSTTRRDYNGAQFSFPTFDNIRFGWALFQSNADTRDVWLDDIAIDTTRIGCGN